MAKEEYPAHLLKSVEIDPKGKLFLKYSNRNKPLVINPGDLSDHPMMRIPIFNILRSESKWKSILEEWLDICLGWRVKFYVEGDIDPEAEDQKWRKAFRIGRLANSEKLSLGTKGKVVNE